MHHRVRGKVSAIDVRQIFDGRGEQQWSAITPWEQEVARLGCDTRTTRERIGWLDQYRSGVMNVPTPTMVGPSPPSEPDGDL